MTRDLAAANETASEADLILPVYFVKLEFDEANVCFHSGLGTITWGGDTYTGAGTLGTVDTVDEDSELSRTPTKLKLSGIDSAIVSIALGSNYQGRPASVYLGFLDTTTRQLVADPSLVRSGFMDTMSITQGNHCEIALQMENELAGWDRAKGRRYNHADQTLRYPNDKGLEFVEKMVGATIAWGTAL